MTKEESRTKPATFDANGLPVAPEGFRLLTARDQTQNGDYFYAHGHWHLTWKSGPGCKHATTSYCRPC